MADMRPSPKSQPSDETLDIVFERAKGNRPIDTTGALDDLAFTAEGRTMTGDLYGEEKVGGWYVVIKNPNRLDTEPDNLEAVPWG